LRFRNAGRPWRFLSFPRPSDGVTPNISVRGYSDRKL
jgi:hypothetical protein